jgi:hypothetical protein
MLSGTGNVALWAEKIIGNGLQKPTGQNLQHAADRTTTPMSSVGGRAFKSAQSVGLYPTSGASDDYAFSRFQVDGRRNEVYGFTMEFGYPPNFYPIQAEFEQDVIDTGAGLTEFCLASAEIGLC